MVGLLQQRITEAFPITAFELSQILGPRIDLGTKGKPKRRIIKTKRIGDRIYEYHATKGWRSRRA